MSKRFTSYNELLKEKQQLEFLLQAQKEVIRCDVEEIKLKLQPVKDALEFVKKITTKDRTNLLLDLGSDIAINTLVKNFILSRAGWFIRLVVPFFLKNYSSHFIAEQKDKWIEKLKSWLGHKNGKEHHDEGEENREESRSRDEG
ncbi:MAG TPA: hypothetical protein VGQ53_03590 [Chitinophagaceae bacterium]|jgi:hypothetical protein|nr:hypothetical protein [Chitinophagaceae bacterium]